MDRENVIKGLEHCKNGDCVGCPYDQIREEWLRGKHDTWELVCNEQLTEDIHSLLMIEEPLKEQETVEPILSDYIVIGTNRKCSKCIDYIFPAGRYCPHCGMPVRWDDD